MKVGILKIMDNKFLLKKLVVLFFIPKKEGPPKKEVIPLHKPGMNYKIQPAFCLVLLNIINFFYFLQCIHLVNIIRQINPKTKFVVDIIQP